MHERLLVMHVLLCLLLLPVGVPSAPPLAGDAYRYRPPADFGQWLGGVLMRTGLDFAAIPAGVTQWQASDFGTFAAVTLLSVGPLIPIAGRSFDARVQDGLREFRAPNCAYFGTTSTLCPAAISSGFHVWTRISDVTILAAAFGVPLLTLGAAAIHGEARLVEAATLAIEAVIVTQAYHLTLKLLTGREGPLFGNGTGVFHGPSLEYFPDGYPSGHAATLFAIASVYSNFYDSPWLSAVLLGAATTLSAFLVLDDSHFLSEVVLGAAMGYFIGRWVVRHRSSKYAAAPAVVVDGLAFSPTPGGGSLSLSLAW